MSRKRKYTYEEKIQACEDYLSGGKSALEICQTLGLGKTKPPGQFWRWISTYRKNGETVFLDSSGNHTYPKEFKMMVVEEYLDGKGSITELAAKYKIPSDATLHNWISLYNSDMELKDYIPKREVYMAESRRKTTKDERIEITQYCIENDRDYKETAEKYDVSYSQIYSWVRKYDTQGSDGLNDRRGLHKSVEEIDEMEKLCRENKRLKRQLEEKDRAVELLKKVQEFERRRYSPKEN